MENTNNLIILYDYYGDLLTDSQKGYFEDYYFNNLSLSEIAENLGVSRNAVHKQLKSSEEKLFFFENKLKMYEKTSKIEKLLDQIKDDKIKKDIINILEGE